MLKSSIVSATLLIVAAPAVAQMAPPNMSPTAVEGGTYMVEPNHTQVSFRVLHMGFTYYTGRFSGISGMLDLKPQAPADSSVDISIPVESVSTTSAKLDSELKDKDWLDAASFPTMTFKSTKVTPGKGGDAAVAGNLTIHGVTKPVVLHAHFVGSGPNPLDKKYTAGFEISGDIDRSAFGVSKYIPLIGAKVHLMISGAFERT